MVLCSSTLELDVLLTPPSTCKLSLLSSEAVFASASTDMLGEEVVELSRVRFFLGTSTHSDISITASARSKERIPLLLREKCKFVLMGEDKFRNEYLNNIDTTQTNPNQNGEKVATASSIKAKAYQHKIQEFANLTSHLHLSNQTHYTEQIWER